MLFLFKINKVNFYHHYFRVIEEVEIRNSQALASPSLVMFSTGLPVKKAVQPLLWLFSGALTSLLLVFFPLQARTGFEAPFVRRDMCSFHLLPLVRAP